MSKQSNQRYRKEMELNHKERAKDSNSSPTTNDTNISINGLPSKEGYGDGNLNGSSDSTSNNN